MGRLLAIGDIHGNFKSLKSAWDASNIQDDDIVVFLGDYTDRGDENIKVMKFMIDIAERPNTYLLMGNHEQMMLDNISAVLGDESINALTPEMLDRLSIGVNVEWNFNGGDATIKEAKENMDLFTDYISMIVDKSKLFHNHKYDSVQYLFVHAGIDPEVGLDKQTESSVLWIREQFLYNYHGDLPIVVGHTPVQFCTGDNKPVISHNIYMCDTGSYMPGGCVTIVDVGNRTYKSGVENPFIVHD